VPNSHLAQVLPNPLPPGWTGPEAIITAWNGAAYDTKRDRFIVWGGGHNDYGGNEIYAFDLATLTWSRVWGPSPNIPPPGGGSCNDTFSDGNPSSRHTYAGIEYLPTIDRFFTHGGIVWCGSGGGTRGTWTFDFTTLKWQKRSDSPGSSGAPIVAFDPASGLVLARARQETAVYDPSSGSWTRIAGHGWSEESMTGAVDPVRRKFVVVGGGRFIVYNITSSGGLVEQAVSSTGGGAVINTQAPGFVYDPDVGKFVAWIGGSDVYTLDMGTMQWTKYARLGGGNPLPAVNTGTFGRWRYIPSMKVFITVSDINQNVWIYRFPSSGSTLSSTADTVPPSAPTSLTATTVSASQINLSWGAATDNVGVVGYRVLRDGVEVAVTLTTSYQSTGLSPLSSYTYHVFAYDAVGNASPLSNSATQTTPSGSTPPPPLPPPSPGQISLPLNTWIAVAKPPEGTGPCPSGQYGDCKHMRLAHNPVNGRIYFHGGDYTGPVVDAQSGRQELYSYSIKDNNWILEYPYCGPAGDVQPKHPDEVGWTYDTKRNVFWSIPGVYLSFPPVNCPSTLATSRPMTFNPATKKWTLVNAPLADSFTEYYKFANYDPVTDTIIMPYGSGSGGIAIFDIKSNSWQKVPGGDQFNVGQEYSAIDVQGRVVYLIDPTAGALWRYNIDSQTFTYVKDTPAGTRSAEDVAMPIWDSVNKVLLWPQTPNHAGVITLWVYHPDTNQWENKPTNQPNGLLVQGNSAVFDPYQNVLLVMGGIDFSGQLPPPQHLFLYRYGTGAGSESRPPAAPSGLRLH
jgi:hypothetical protein